MQKTSKTSRFFCFFVTGQVLTTLIPFSSCELPSKSLSIERENPIIGVRVPKDALIYLQKASILSQRASPAS